MSAEKIGRYVIKSELGRGGMATVFHAYDPSFERDVAIKVLPPAYLHEPQLRMRFEREAKMIASLEHPAIVPVYDFGEENAQPYIVMRLMAGGSLADRLKTGPVPLEETAHIISRLAPALDAAHARGIIHRDIKPGNVLFDQYGNAFLSDFGIARQSSDGGASATITGENILGTPAYMSPEQVQGDKAIDGRSDIYAMGVLVYQMITGQAPYQADTPAKVMLMHILEPVPNLLERRTDLPAGCQEMISHAMAKDPTDRYTTTQEMAVDLDALTRGAPTVHAAKAPLADRTVISGQGFNLPSRPNLAPAPVTGHPTRPPVVPSGSYVPPPPPPITAYPSPAATPLPVKTGGRSWGIWIGAGLALLLVGGAIVAGFAFILQQNRQMISQLLPATAAATAASVAAETAPGTDTALPPSPTSGVEDAGPTETSLPVVAVVDTPTPEPTLEPTLEPTPTATLAPSLPVLGGADQIAYLSGGNIWSANVDGSDLVQLTTDGAQKTSLQWTPDGSGVTYVSGKCVHIAYLETGSVDNIACFNFIDALKSFSISPDNRLAALTFDNQMYIVPFDIPTLQQVNSRDTLADMAACQDFAPYKKNFITQVRWSNDSTVIAAKLIANLGDGRQGDIVQLFKVDQCIPNPRAIDNFPPPRFTIKGYDKQAVIQNFSWDGVFLFALTSIVRNEGFGDLYVYNTDLHKAYPEINPVGDTCCYRDPAWSPDGQYLAFAYQDRLGGAASTTQIYYIPYSSIGTGATYQPLPLPDITDPRERPQPVLRKAK